MPGVPARRTASGLTLLEMLVVFVLTSLVATLLIQGASFFLGQYDTVKRIGREASTETLQQRWFASTVHAMVPYQAEDRRFVGDARSFQGITMQPLRARSGTPLATGWSIVAGQTGFAVVYSEQMPRTGAEHVRWTVLESRDPLAFQYQGLDRAWRDRWIFGETREGIPRQVRLVTSDGQTVWNASFGLYPQPVGNPRDFR